MRQPDGYSTKTIKDWDTDFCTERGYWEPARPLPTEGLYPWTWRFKLAWDVFTGKADVIYWTER